MSERNKNVKLSEEAHKEARVGAAKKGIAIVEFIERAINELFKKTK